MAADASTHPLARRAGSLYGSAVHEPPSVSGKARRVLAVLLLVHVAWGAARLPDKAIGRRRDDIARFLDRGQAGYFLQHSNMVGTEAMAWIVANTAAESVILYEGPTKGALEFAPGVLAPRLVVAASACAPGSATYAGRQVARGRIGDREGVVHLLASDSGLRVEVR